MLVEIILSVIGEAALGYSTDKGFKLFKSNAANKEIAEIGSAAIEAGICVVPALADDMRSVSFAKCVFVPVLQTTVSDPSGLPDPEGLAQQFVQMFVERYTRDDCADDVLRRVFQTEPSDLVAAFAAILRELRTQFYKSKHWRDVGHYLATETTLANTTAILALLERQDREDEVAATDLTLAISDAKLGSDELRSWPRDIGGHELLRPELESLRQHILAQPGGTSILIGEAGSGKSALMSKLTEDLEREGHVVFGIKADTLPASIQSIDDVGRALGMAGSLSTEIAAVARSSPVVLIIDQLDAVSDVMDRSSDRMKVLLRMVRHIREQRIPAHVIVSSRPFEAAHDARFQQLKAEEFNLALPSEERVGELLTNLQIDWKGISDQLKETLRRPFALKLFVQLARRGVAPSSIEAGDLLDRWLATADLGPDSSRRAVLDLMQILASEMLETETLWRPADVYEAERKEALARAEACGLVVRSGRKIGFSHQSWLDDFQAKGFRSGSDLAEYAWQNQDSLFVRATVLRALQRLRVVDDAAYARAVSALLGDVRTRRHLRHLVTDAISSVRQPTVQEGAWVENLLSTDAILANRAFGKAVENWSNWRLYLAKCLPVLMGQDSFHWRAVQALAEEAKIDPDSMVSLVRLHWDDPKMDQLVFRIAEQSGVITDAVEQMIGSLLSRTAIDPHAISHLVGTLRSEGRLSEACRVVALWAATVETAHGKNPDLYEISKLANEAPLEFCEALMPWFLAQASREVDPHREGIKRYPKSQSLPWDWDYDREPDKVVDAFRDGLSGVAAANASAALPFIASLAEVQIDQVQELAALTYLAAGAALASEALQFLLADQRRFYLGDAHVTLEPGLSSMEAGLTSQELVEAIGQHLPSKALIELRDRIEAWSLYEPDFGNDDTATDRRRRLRWADEHRLELLERLPETILPARRKRQIAEWRKQQRRPIARERGGSMATFVGSPMSVSSMTKASDDDIFRMLDAICDVAPERSFRRPVSRDGGIVELSRAFAEFGKSNPERSVRLTDRFVAGRHEHAAGYLIEELSKDNAYPPAKLLKLIHDLSAKGFSSRTWKTHSAWALSRLADPLKGLPDDTVSLLESWLDNDPERIERQIEQRLSMDAENERRNKREKSVPTPLLFQAHGGMRIVPQDNYSLLAAIFHGLLGREDQPYDAWLNVLERYASKAEDPHIWSFLLSDKGRWLFWADRARVRLLLARLGALDFRIFMNTDLVGLLWTKRAMFPHELMVQICEAWFASDDSEFKQAAAELVQAMVLVEPDSDTTLALSGRIKGEPSPELTGALFSAAAAWEENEPPIRERAHNDLLRHTSNAEGDQAHAISSAIDRTDRLAPDDLTRELIQKIADNPAVLSASLTGRFADGLQSLLLYPGFDEPVMYVTERVAKLIVGDKGGRHRGFIDKDFVQVTIALQRSDGPLRSRAMDVYEALLDAGAYGAEQAARDAVGR